MNRFDPVIAPDVLVHKVRADYFRKCATVEHDPEVVALFRAKVKAAETAAEVLRAWFVKPPSRRLLTSSLAKVLDTEYQPCNPV